MRFFFFLIFFFFLPFPLPSSWCYLLHDVDVHWADWGAQLRRESGCSFVPRKSHWCSVEIGFVANEAKCSKKLEGNSKAAQCCLENCFYTRLLILELKSAGSSVGFLCLFCSGLCGPQLLLFCLCEVELLCSGNNEDARTVITSTPGQTWNKTILYAGFELYWGERETQNPLNSCSWVKDCAWCLKPLGRGVKNCPTPHWAVLGGPENISKVLWGLCSTILLCVHVLCNACGWNQCLQEVLERCM